MPPAITSTSLLASAMVLPCSMAASTASRPSVPDEAQSTEIDVGVRGNFHETFPARAHTPPGSGACYLPQAVDRRSGRHRDTLGAISRNLIGEPFDVLARGEPHDTQSIGVRVDDGQRALADGAGGAEDGDAFHRFSVVSISLGFWITRSQQLTDQ